MEQLLAKLTYQDYLNSLEIARLYYRYERGGTDMSSVETVPLPEQTVYGVVSCVSIAVLIVMLYMALFGQRMRHTAIRWHVINCSFWGILHLISYSSFAEKAPWPGFITNEDWKATSRQVECFTRSVFPAGMFFIYIEAMLLTCAPRLSEKSIFNFIFFLLLVPVLNGIMIFCYLAHYMNVKWFYEPIDTFNLFTYLLFCIMTFVYFIWCLIGSCMCCASLAHRDGVGPRSMATFSDMWMLMPYGMLPTFMYGPSFGMTSVGFAMKHLTKWANDHGLMGGGGGGDGDGDGGEGGGGGIMGMIDMSMMIELTTNALLAMPWFVLLFPLVQSVLTLVCIRIFREQFFFTISCGRVYEGPRGKIGEQKPSEWPSSATVGPPPMYPTTPKEVA